MARQDEGRLRQTPSLGNVSPVLQLYGRAHTRYSNQTARRPLSGTDTFVEDNPIDALLPPERNLPEDAQQPSIALVYTDLDLWRTIIEAQQSTPPNQSEVRRL